MYKNILNVDQEQLLPFIKSFSSDFYLVGGTTLALNLGHRRSIDFDTYIKLPGLITLGAMKAFALGRRAKWKDYVDLYFIFQKHSFKELMDKTNSIFKAEFNEKLFRTQLGYFDDIDYSEQIEYMPGFEKKDDDIKKFLEKISLS